MSGERELQINAGRATLVASLLSNKARHLPPIAIHLRKHIEPDGQYAPHWPSGTILTAFEQERHARPARGLLNIAYAAGGGSVLDFDDWWPALASDAEYRPDLCFVALDSRSGALAAFAQCWSLGFIKDIAVAAAWRRRGLGKAMMLEIFRTFQARGILEIDLRVTADNPSRAPEFYASLGMVEVD